MDRHHFAAHFVLVSLVAISVFAQDKSRQEPLTCANKINCDVVRYQQYFCIARCISFVRDEAPSTLTSNGTCPAVNWWYRPTTTTTTPAPSTTTTALTTTAAVSSDSCTDLKGFEKCCKTPPYDNLFPDDDEDCKHKKMEGSDYKNVQRDSQIYKFVSATGEFQVGKVDDAYWFYYDCLFKQKKLVDDYEVTEKSMLKFLKKQVEDSYHDAIEETYISKCIKLTKKLAKAEDKVEIYNGKGYQMPFLFNICLRRELYLKCKKTTTDECSTAIDKFKNCDITVKK